MNRQEERAPRRRCTELVEEGEVIARPGEVVRVQPRDEDVTVILPEPSVANDGQDVVVSFEGDGTAAGKVRVVPMAGTCAKPGVTTLNSPGSYHFTSTGGAVAKRQNAAVPTDPGAPTSSPGWSGPGDIVTDDLPDDGVTNDKLDEMPGNSVKVNATATDANPTDLTVAADSFVGRLGGNLNDVPLADIDSASVPYDAASHTFQRAALTGFATASQNGNATSSAEPIVTFSASANMSNERVATSSTSVLVSTSVASQIEFQSAAKTGDVTAAQNSNAFAFRSFSALSVLARASNSTGIPTELAAGANNRVLARTSDTLAFQQITAAMLADGTVILAAGTYHDLVIADNITDIICNGVVTITGIAGGWNGRVVRITGGNSGTLTLPHGSASSTAGNTFTMPASVDYVQARGGAVLVYDTGPSTDTWRCIATAQPTLDGDRGDITVAALVWTIDNDAVTDAKLRNSAALSVIGRSANSSGDPADISTTSSSAAVLRESGGVLGFGTVATAGITDDAVTDAKLRNSAALSVIGRASNSSGDPADIAAANDGEVLRRSGTTLGFGTIATGGLADDSVTDAKLRESTALSVIGRAANSTGNPADIAASTDGHVLRRSGTTLGFGTVATAGLADSSVTRSKLAPGVQSFTTAGLSSDVQVNTDTTVLRVDSGNSAWSIDGFVRQGGNFNGDWFILENASNASSTGTLVTGGSSVSATGNQIITPGNINRGGHNRYSALMVYDGTDSFWRIAADTYIVTDTDKGDITVSGSGLTWTIDSAAVSLAKMANLAQSTIIGRAEGAGTGVPQALTPAQVRAIVGGTLIARTVHGSSGNHVMNSETTRAIVTMVGGGGAGGGAEGGGIGTGMAAGGGGGSGAYLQLDITSNLGTHAYSVGAGGAGATGLNGNDGGDTTFHDGSATRTAEGGAGGAVCVLSTSHQVIAAGLGGSRPSSTGAFNRSAGNPGTNGITLNLEANGIGWGGSGGAGPWGGGAYPKPSTEANGDGADATGPGGGGGGAWSDGSTTDRAGGDGFDGIIIVEEYT